MITVAKRTVGESFAQTSKLQRRLSACLMRVKQQKSAQYLSFNCCAAALMVAQAYKERGA